VFIQFVACVNEGETSASRSYSYVPNAGPTWFLVWLLIFNVVYASLPDNFPPMNLTSPGVLKMSMWAVTLVVIQLVLMFLMETFVFMPITIGSLPFNILFFACGVLAKRGGWLDKGLDVPSTTTRYFPVAFSLCYIGAFFAFMVYTFHIGGGSVMPTDTTTDGDNHGRGMTLGLVLFAAASGLFGNFFSVTVFRTFRNFFNSESGWTKFFSDSAYTLYLIHPFLVIPLTYSWVVLLRVFLQEEIVFAPDSSSSGSVISNDIFLWAGWIYVATLSLALGWPCAHYLRKLPGLNRIL